MSLSSISPGSLLDSPLASTLTTSTNQALSTGTGFNTSTSANGSTSYSSPDPLTQDLVSLLKALAYGDIAGAKSSLAKYKADLKTQTTAASNNGAKEAATLSKELTSASSGVGQASNAGESLVASISASLNSGSVRGALQALTSYLVQSGQVSGGLINTLG